MKRHILLLFIAFIGINAMAQNYSSSPAVHRQTIDICGSRVYEGYTKLDKNDAAACFSSINGVDRSSDYLKYRAGYERGLGLTFGGASLAVVGFGAALGGFVTALEQSLAGEDYVVAETVCLAGVFSCVAGSICFAAGIPTICVYKVKLNRLEKGYNRSLEFATSGKGLSMALKF